MAEEQQIAAHVWEPESEGDARLVEIRVGDKPTWDDEVERLMPGVSEDDPAELREKLEAFAGVSADDDESKDRAPRAFTAAEIRAEDDEKRLIRFVIATEDVGRDGDVVRVAGLNFTPYRKNPVWLWSHDRWGPPIGRIAELVKDGVAKTVEASVQFAAAELNPVADMVYRLHKARFLRGCSISWIPLKVTRPDDELRKELGLGPWGVVHEKSELLEVSSVTVPADRKALQKSVGEGAVRGLLFARDVALAERTLGASERESDRDAFAAFREAWTTLHRVVISEDTVGRLSAIAGRLNAEEPRMSDADSVEPRAPDADVPGRHGLYADFFDRDAELARRIDKLAQCTGG